MLAAGPVELKRTPVFLLRTQRAMASITLTNVQKAFERNTPIIRNVHLEVGENEFCVFLGPSGCGKSTLLRMVAGLTAGATKG